MKSSVKLTVLARFPARIVAIHDEEWLEGSKPELEQFHSFPRENAPRPDIFTFARPLPENRVHYSYSVQWDNVAVAQLENGFAHWWEGLPQETRKNVRRSQRRGVTVSSVPFDDQLVHGISNIYNETPIRQGRKFPHYRKTLEQVRAENSSYLDRAQFIAAMHNGALIGFMKFVMVNNVARIMQIVSLDAHTDKRPTNALLAKAIEICCAKGASHLVYGKFVYGKKENSPVTEFKRRNGFERLSFPRYYVPITMKGKVALRCGLHLGLKSIIPENLLNLFLAARAAAYRRKFPQFSAGVAQR